MSPIFIWAFIMVAAGLAEIINTLSIQHNFASKKNLELMTHHSQFVPSANSFVIRHRKGGGRGKALENNTNIIYDEYGGEGSRKKVEHKDKKPKMDGMPSTKWSKTVQSAKLANSALHRQANSSPNGRATAEKGLKRALHTVTNDHRHAQHYGATVTVETVSDRDESSSSEKKGEINHAPPSPARHWRREHEENYTSPRSSMDFFDSSTSGEKRFSSKSSSRSSSAYTSPRLITPSSRTLMQFSLRNPKLWLNSEHAATTLNWHCSSLQQEDQKQRCKAWEAIHCAIKHYIKFQKMKSSQNIISTNDSFLATVALRPRFWLNHVNQTNAEKTTPKRMAILNGKRLNEQRSEMGLTFAMLNVEDAYRWQGKFIEEPLQFVNKMVVEKVKGWAEFLANFLNESPPIWEYRFMGDIFDGTNVTKVDQLLMIARFVLTHIAQNELLLEGIVDDNNIPEPPSPIVRPIGNANKNRKMPKIIDKEYNASDNNDSSSDSLISIKRSKLSVNRLAEHSTKIGEKVIGNKPTETDQRNDQQVSMLNEQWQQIEHDLRKELQKRGKERYINRQQNADPSEASQLVIDDHSRKRIILIPKEEEIVGTIYKIVNPKDIAEKKALGKNVEQAWQNAKKCQKFVSRIGRKERNKDRENCKMPIIAENRAEIFHQWKAIGHELQSGRGILPLYKEKQSGEPLREKQLLLMVEKAFNALVNGEPKLPRLPVMVKENNDKERQEIGQKMEQISKKDYDGLKGYGGERHRMPLDDKQLRKKDLKNQKSKAHLFFEGEVEAMKKQRGFINEIKEKRKQVAKGNTAERGEEIGRWRAKVIEQRRREQLEREKRGR